MEMKRSIASETFTGLPVIVVSDVLPLASESTFCGLRVVPVAIASLARTPEPALGADILAAVLATAAERAWLEEQFSRRCVALPPVSINPTRTEAAQFVAQALNSRTRRVGSARDPLAPSARRHAAGGGGDAIGSCKMARSRGGRHGAAIASDGLSGRTCRGRTRALRRVRVVGDNKCRNLRPRRSVATP